MIKIILNVILKIFLSIIFGGIIGFERENKNRPAGMKTHILVCIGATIISLIQNQIYLSTLENIILFPELSRIISLDNTRLISQVVSGVGFLGAGTIIVNKYSVVGLTTAASLWAISGIGIAIGMGYYLISIISLFGILISLALLKKIINIPIIKKLEITYFNKKNTNIFLNDYFKKHKFIIKNKSFYMDLNKKIFINNYYIKFYKKNIIYKNNIIKDILMYKNIIKVKIN